MNNKTRYYKSFSDDFEQSANQDFKLPEDYKWIRTDLKSKLLSGLNYGLAVIFGGLYCKLGLHMKIRGRKSLRGSKGDFFIFANHTQPVGDVFIPAMAVLPKRIFTVVSPANYGIPFIGKLLPYLGALPIDNSLRGMKELTHAIEQRLDKKHPIVIYPEAHVWEYYTGIRPFADTAFKYPVKMNKASYAMTVTYKKSKLFKKPVMEVFLDGPFYGEGETAKEQAVSLHSKVAEVMKKRSENSNFEYIKYLKDDT